MEFHFESWIILFPMPVAWLGTNVDDQEPRVKSSFPLPEKNPFGAGR
jgi:hypothetical protein